MKYAHLITVFLVIAAVSADPSPDYEVVGEVKYYLEGISGVYQGFKAGLYHESKISEDCLGPKIKDKIAEVISGLIDGADGGNILKMVMRQGFWQLAIGLFLGISVTIGISVLGGDGLQGRLINLCVRKDVDQHCCHVRGDHAAAFGDACDVHSLAADQLVKAQGERGLMATELLPVIRRLLNPGF